MRFWIIFIFCLSLVVGKCSTPGYAYTEEIGLKIDQVWPAVKETFKKTGVSKVNDSKKVLETKWIYDQVVRRGKYLKNVISQKYDRRYRLKIKLTENYYFTNVEIRGVFQERSMAVAPETPWRSVRPKKDDLEVERAYFFRLLNQLERMKKENAI